VALAPRVPPAAQQLVVNRHLVREVDDAFSDEDLAAAAEALLEHGSTLSEFTRQSYLYSGMEPPGTLIQLWESALWDGPPHQTTSLRSEVIRPPLGSDVAPDTVLRTSEFLEPGGINVALLGAGDYARTEIIPALRAAGLSLHVVADRDPQLAAIVGRSHRFQFATTDAKRAIAELPHPGLVVIATAHDSHADLACRAVESGHRVFLEKPPTVTDDDVTRLADVMSLRPGRVEIGFNRRYHPLVRRARARLVKESGPMSITCTVKEIEFEPDHWYFWPNQGTRVSGNLCHWIDLAVFLLDGQALPVTLTLSPRVLGSISEDEERVLTATFDDGSLLTILGTTRGDDIRGVQEQIEVRRGRTTIVIDDLWKMRVRSGGIDRHFRSVFRGKAHERMYKEALGRVVRGEPAVYPLSDMLTVSAIQRAGSDLIRSGAQVGGLPEWLPRVKTRVSQAI
jgi:predicted dehydrogenase